MFVYPVHGWTSPLFRVQRAGPGALSWSSLSLSISPASLLSSSSYLLHEKLKHGSNGMMTTARVHSFCIETSDIRVILGFKDHIETTRTEIPKDYIKIVFTSRSAPSAVVALAEGTQLLSELPRSSTGKPHFLQNTFFCKQSFLQTSFFYKPHFFTNHGFLQTTFFVNQVFLQTKFFSQTH